jgi:hypothetical protein
MSDIFAKLRAPFPNELISWRVGATNAKKNGGVATKGIGLAYVDARDVMQRLDDVVGPGNWQAIHPHANGKTSCRTGIKVGEEWVWKENGAGDSETEAEKGAFSDSFKRAAVLWGIGRYLYDVPNVWVELDEWKQIKDSEKPKLFAALEKAAKGIRTPNEPEPVILPLTGEELITLNKALREATSLEELGIAKEKVEAAWHRMTKEQRKTIGDAGKQATSRLAQAPIAA